MTWSCQTSLLKERIQKRDYRHNKMMNMTRVNDKKKSQKERINKIGYNGRERERELKKVYICSV